MDKWIGRNAVVTGGSSGIGKGILKELLKTGINVVGLARNVDKFDFDDEVKEYSGKLFVHHCDVADSLSVAAAFEWIERNVGTVSILINNAGIFKFTTILNDDDNLNADLQRTMDVNLMGSVFCARQAYKSLIKSQMHGYIININSVGGHYVPLPRAELPSLNTYAPSKHGVSALTQVLRHELTWSGNHKIRVASLSPGETRTSICESAGSADNYYSINPTLDVENVAAAVVFILSLPYNVQVSELTMRCVGARV